MKKMGRKNNQKPAQQQQQPAKQINYDQRKVMVDFIRQHPGCNTGNFDCPHNEKAKEEAWETLTSLLNAMPGVSKDWQGWLKCFQDWKSECKKKMQEVKKEKTGNSHKKPKISDLELICMNEFIYFVAVEGNGCPDPDRDLEEVAQHEAEGGVDGESGANEEQQFHLSLDDNLPMDIISADGSIVSVISPGPSGSKNLSSTTPSSRKRSKTPSELRKRAAKIYKKEMQLDEDRVIENEHLQSHLADSKRSADALESIATSLGGIAAMQQAILEEQKKQTMCLEQFLNKF